MSLGTSSKQFEQGNLGREINTHNEAIHSRYLEHNSKYESAEIQQLEFLEIIEKQKLPLRKKRLKKLIKRKKNAKKTIKKPKSKKSKTPTKKQLAKYKSQLALQQQELSGERNLPLVEQEAIKWAESNINEEQVVNHLKLLDPIS